VTYSIAIQTPHIGKRRYRPDEYAVTARVGRLRSARQSVQVTPVTRAAVVNHYNVQPVIDV